MKSLRESILADMDDVLKSGDEVIKDSILQWLKENLTKRSDYSDYKISEKPNKDGKYKVSFKEYVEFNRNATSLTNGMFVWAATLYSNFSCSGCPKLTSLEGGPKKVKYGFSCSYCNSLTSLKGAPETVGGSFRCNDCDNLKSLEGAPKIVGIDFVCYNCDSLTSLVVAPKEVGRDFDCSHCSKLISLKGAPETVDKNFHCYYCDSLQTLEGAPKTVGGNFNCYNCGKQFTKDEVKSLCDAKKGIYV